MAVKNKNVVIAARKAAGADLVRHKPVFSHDSKYMFVSCEWSIKVFSTASGELVRELKAHKEEIVCMLLNPKNQLQLISCSCNEVAFWDYVDGICHQVIEAAKPIRRVLWPSFQSCVYILTGKLELYEAAEIKKPASTWHLVNRRFSDTMVDGLSGTYLAAFKKNQLFVYFTSNKQTKIHSMANQQRFTCIATHPSEYCFATGDYSGRIFVWYNFVRGEFIRSTFHWHQLPVADLMFTAAGSAIVSGGAECVLVHWKIDTDTRRFVPRLGMPMVYVTGSPSNTIIATSHVDNAIRLLDNQGVVLHTVQGLTKGHLWKEFGWNPVPTGLLYDPQNRALVMNGRPGHLQFFSYAEDKQLFNLDITTTNFYHSEKEFKVFPIEVEKAAFDSTGQWLATVERRTDGVSVSDFRLKFWNYRVDRSNYVLNTSVEFPHQGKVVSLKFQPRAKNGEDTALVVTSSNEDNRFKFWKLVDDSDIYKTKVAWSCESVGYYRDMPCGPVAFSEDGSVLAVACGNVTTLWTANNCDLNATLCHPRIEEDISELEFGNKECANLIVCATKKLINIWDVISLTVKWCVNLNIACLAKDYASSIMAVFSGDGDLVVFKPSSPTPIYCERKVCSKPVIHAAFVPNAAKRNDADDELLPWQNHSTLCFLNEDQLLLEVTNNKEAEKDPVSMLSVHLQSTLPLTPFGMLLAKKRKSDVKEKEVSYEKPRATKEVLREMLTSPSNTLPPVDVLFDLHLSCCIRKEAVKADEEAVPDKTSHDQSLMEVDFDSEDEVAENSEKEKKETQDVRFTEDSVSASQLLEETEVLEKVLDESFEWLRL